MTARAEQTSEYVAVAAADDVPPGWAIRVRIGSRTLAVANHEGTFYAMDDACSHAAGPLGDNRIVSGCLLECPWHGARFDVRSGEVERGPARKAQKTFEARVEEGTVFVRLGEEGSS